MNRSKDLKDLFRQSLINARKQYSYPTTSPMYSNNPNAVGGIKVYFYEWSDVTRAPRVFYSIQSFNFFLKNSGINIQEYQKDIIINLQTTYISCYTGTKLLDIRASYKNLLDSMNEYNANKLVPKIQQPHQPKFVFEPQGRWPEDDGTFFG